MTAAGDDKTLIVIVGPTAVGKTQVAVHLAEHFTTEIISADSRQIFREMNIGTAKPSQDERKAAKHHFIDSHSVMESYDAAAYGKDALMVIQELFKTHQHVVLCGGSGLYVKAVCEGFDDIPDIPQEIRQSLIADYERFGIGWLQEKMRVLDPKHYSSIDNMNPHRLIRALEVVMETGKSIVSFRKRVRHQHPFRIVKIGLDLPKEELNHRIDTRMDAMIAAGLIQEAQALYRFKDHQALKTVGYQEVFDMMEGKYDEAEMIRLLKRNSRHYAKRQLTWFRRDPEIIWMNPFDIDEIISAVSSAGKASRDQ